MARNNHRSNEECRTGRRRDVWVGGTVSRRIEEDKRNLITTFVNVWSLPESKCGALFACSPFSRQRCMDNIIVPGSLGRRDG